METGNLSLNGQCGKANEILAATCDFQQCGSLASINSDEPEQPPNIDIQTFGPKYVHIYCC